MNNLKEKLDNLSENVNKYSEILVTSGEEQVKQSVILPFIDILGFNINDPYEVSFEEKIHSGKADCIIKINNTIILIECKKFSYKLTQRTTQQLALYFNSYYAEQKIGIATNGKEFKLYKKLSNNQMELKPYYEFNLLDLKEQDYEEIEKITKQYIKESNNKQDEAYDKFRKSSYELFSHILQGDISYQLIQYLKSEAGINKSEYDDIKNSELQELAQQELEKVVTDTFKAISEAYNNQDITKRIDDELDWSDFEELEMEENNDTENTEEDSDIKQRDYSPIIRDGYIPNLKRHNIRDISYKEYKGCKFEYFEYKGIKLNGYSMRKLLIYIIDDTIKNDKEAKEKIIKNFNQGVYKIIIGQALPNEKVRYTYIDKYDISVTTKLSTPDIFRFIQNILDLFGIPYSNLIISVGETGVKLRKNKDTEESEVEESKEIDEDTKESNIQPVKNGFLSSILSRLGI